MDHGGVKSVSPGLGRDNRHPSYAGLSACAGTRASRFARPAPPPLPHSAVCAFRLPSNPPVALLWVVVGGQGNLGPDHHPVGRLASILHPGRLFKLGMHLRIGVPSTSFSIAQKSEQRFGFSANVSIIILQISIWHHLSPRRNRSSPRRVV